jgi:hypothetical protein
MVHFMFTHLLPRMQGNPEGFGCGLGLEAREQVFEFDSIRPLHPTARLPRRTG